MIGKGNQAYSDSPLESPASIDRNHSGTLRFAEGHAAQILL